MRAETPSASRAGLPKRLQQQCRAHHQQVTKRLRQTTGTQKSEGHRPPWPESWRLGNVSGASVELARQAQQTSLSQRGLGGGPFNLFRHRAADDTHYRPGGTGRAYAPCITPVTSQLEGALGTAPL